MTARLYINPTRREAPTFGWDLAGAHIADQAAMRGTGFALAMRFAP
jgi:hypothetical protein